MSGSLPHAKSFALRLFQPKTEGFIRRHLASSASQKPATKAALDMRKLFIKETIPKTN